MRTSADSVVYKVEVIDERTITIPWPHTLPKTTGIHSTDRAGGSVKTRMSDQDVQLVQEEALQLGLSVSMLTRWVILNACAELRRLRDGTRPHISP